MTPQQPDGPASPAARQMFEFEADFAADLRCLPMAVRRKLDLAGVKLKRNQWHGLTAGERQRLLEWDDGTAAIESLRDWLLERSASLPDGRAGSLEPTTQAAWQQGKDWPESLRHSCGQLNLAIREEGWQELSELQRFALVKLSHPGHEHRNLPRALAEFGLLR